MNLKLRNRKHVPCFYRVIQTREEVWGEREMLWEHEPQASVFHSKINFATAKSISSQQNQFRLGKINFITTKSVSQTQNQFSHGLINFSTAKSIWHTAQSISQYGKINLTHGTINFTIRQNQFHSQLKSISLKTKSFWLSRSRDIGSQSAMGVKPKCGVPRGLMNHVLLELWKKCASNSTFLRAVWTR